jgi:hypothetical protein
MSEIVEKTWNQIETFAKAIGADQVAKGNLAIGTKNSLREAAAVIRKGAEESTDLVRITVWGNLATEVDVIAQEIESRVLQDEAKGAGP